MMEEWLEVGIWIVVFFGALYFIAQFYMHDQVNLLDEVEDISNDSGNK